MCSWIKAFLQASLWEWSHLRAKEQAKEVTWWMLGQGAVGGVILAKSCRHLQMPSALTPMKVWPFALGTLLACAACKSLTMRGVQRSDPTSQTGQFQLQSMCLYDYVVQVKYRVKCWQDCKVKIAEIALRKSAAVCSMEEQSQRLLDSGGSTDCCKVHTQLQRALRAWGFQKSRKASAGTIRVSHAFRCDKFKG